ncbi:hypothetical protein L1049_025020 [Liquidambar formosana]|uniref:F-box domain-containing protein n=1 Tax=Liquidambar formosana TaxID=63359 RepID=A0AAP0WYW1_LIQFO
MDDLPPPLLLDILSRLNDSTDLARCRLVSKTLNALSYEVRSINLFCSFGRYMKSRSPETKTLITPFKTIFNNLILSSRSVDSISVGVRKPLRGLSYDAVEDESDDLYLTDVNFVKEWLPGVVCEGLKSLSISDFWVQSCWRRSEVLVLISSCCHSLLNLEVKNSWLSVDGLSPMPALTSLTLEFIRLDDEDLNKVNECFPSLKVLNLIGVGGLKDPRIHQLQLKTCQWMVSNAPLSLTIHAPNLVKLKLKLKCVKPQSLVLETPLLSDFHLSLENAGECGVKEFLNLKTLHLESTGLWSLIGTFPFGRTVKNLTVDSLKQSEPVEIKRFNLETLSNFFPNVSSLKLGPGAWSELETCFRLGGLEGKIGMKKLKEITGHLMVYDIDITISFISSVLDKYTSLSNMALLIHCEVDSSITSNLISRCSANWPRVKWRWGRWKEGMKDTWVCDSI